MGIRTQGTVFMRYHPRSSGSFLETTPSLRRFSKQLLLEQFDSHSQDPGGDLIGVLRLIITREGHGCGLGHGKNGHEESQAPDAAMRAVGLPARTPDRNRPTCLVGGAHPEPGTGVEVEFLRPKALPVGNPDRTTGTTPKGLRQVGSTEPTASRPRRQQRPEPADVGGRSRVGNRNAETTGRGDTLAEVGRETGRRDVSLGRIQDGPDVPIRPRDPRFPVGKEPGWTIETPGANTTG